MAGLTTASLVSLYEPPPPSPPRPLLSSYLQLAQHASPKNALSLLFSSFASISFLVFLATSQPFILASLPNPVPDDDVGSVTARLVFVDEIVALSLYAVWGVVADRIGVRWVAVSGHALVGAGLILYVVARSVGGLVGGRIVFAMGASALVTALTAAMSGMQALPVPQERSGAAEEYDNERLLDDVEEEASLQEQEVEQQLEQDGVSSRPRKAHPHNSARFAGLLGFSTGCGALLAVFVFLPLPAHIVALRPKLTLTEALHDTYFLVAGIAFLTSLYLIWGLKTKVIAVKSVGQSQSWGEALKVGFNELPLGFVFAYGEKEIALGYAAGFACRATSTVITAFIPLLINHYFTRHHLCKLPLLFVESPASQSCRPSYILSSILTGIAQLVSLLLSPVLGHLSSYLPLPLVLALTSALGIISFLPFALIDDVRSTLLKFATIGLGINQIGGIVVGMALVAKGRGELMVRRKREAEVTGDGKLQAREVAGALSAGYSVSGGIGILITGNIGGLLFDRWTGAPFAIVAGLNAVVGVFAAIVWWSTYKRGGIALT